MPNLSILLAPLVLGAAAIAGPQIASVPRPLKFSIKADLGLAPQVDAVLRRVAEPAELRIPPGTMPQALLARLCGTRAPQQFEIVTHVEAGVSSQFVRYQPCLRETSNLKTRVSPGDTLEAIAIRFGMRGSSVGKLAVQGKSGPVKAGPKASISPGDTVVAAKAPAWTSFTARPGTVHSRAELVELIAKEIGCGSEEPESCLAKRSVLLVEDKPIEKHEQQYRTPVLTPSKPAVRNASAPAIPAPVGAAAWPVGRRAPVIGLAASATLQPAPAQNPETAPVDPAQWPYDADLVEKILLDANAQGVLTPRIFIGVAENGLGDKYGRPLPTAAFINEAGDQPLTNGQDDDGNNYVDDWIGAGVLRGPDEVQPSGDVSLCPSSGQVYASWQSDELQRMSHGSVVAAIAGGGGLLSRPALTPILPRLVFFRMAKKVCAQADDDGSGEREAIAAVDYLILRETSVLNLSFFSDGDSGQVLTDRLKSVMSYQPPLLVLPAGNYISGDLDDTRSCPACLGNDTIHSNFSRLTLVVGAATRDRKVSDYSGYGAHTVKIYAPGEPLGSLNLAGQSADSLLPATSYSAPRVSFAAGLIQQLGVREIPKVRGRLLLSTWPLHPDDQSKIDGAGGILDLAKAAAVRHHSVEVIMPGPDGNLVRHTFVGKITGGLEGLCPGQLFSEASVQAIRFGAPDANGYRNARITYRQVDATTRDARTRNERCKPNGTLKLDAIRDGQKALDLRDVSLVLFRGKYP